MTPLFATVKGMRYEDVNDNVFRHANCYFTAANNLLIIGYVELN